MPARFCNLLGVFHPLLFSLRRKAKVSSRGSGLLLVTYEYTDIVPVSLLCRRLSPCTGLSTCLRAYCTLYYSAYGGNHGCQAVALVRSLHL